MSQWRNSHGGTASILAHPSDVSWVPGRILAHHSFVSWSLESSSEIPNSHSGATTFWQHVFSHGSAIPLWHTLLTFRGPCGAVRM
eukprot:2377174-Pyramimonas_sp.AAC.1